MQTPLTYLQILFAGALSLHESTGWNAKLCLLLELLLISALFLASAKRNLRLPVVQLGHLLIRAWLTASMAMMVGSYSLLILKLR